MEASGLSILSDEPRGRDDYAALQAGRPMGISGNTKSQLKSMAHSVARAKSPERPLDCHSFVAVILQKPRPEMGVLLGHTNTEYGTQTPVYGSNANVKVC